MAFKPPALDTLEESSGFTPPPVDSREIEPSDIKLDPYQQLQYTHGRQDPLGARDTDLLAAIGQDPKGFLKSIPGSILGVFTGVGDVARGSAADLVSGIAGQPEYGGNIASMMTGDDRLPVDKFLGEVAQTNPELATVGKVSQGLARMAPLAGVGMLPSLAQRLAAAGFSAQMISDAPELATELGNELGKPPDQRDLDKLTTLTSDAIQIGAFAPLAGYGAYRRSGLQARVEPQAFYAREIAGALKNEPIVLPEGSPTPIRRLGSRISENPLENPDVAPFVEQAFKERRGEHIFSPGELPALEMMRLQENPIQLTPERNITGREGRLLESDPVRGLQYRTPEEGPGSLRTTENIRLEEAGGIPKREGKPGGPGEVLEVPFRSLEQQLLGERGPNAERIRSDQGQLARPGAELERIEANRGSDVQQAPPEPVARKVDRQGDQPTAVSQEAIAKELNLRPEGEMMDRWGFSIIDKDGQPATFYVKKGSTKADIEARANEVRASFEGSAPLGEVKDFDADVKRYNDLTEKRNALIEADKAFSPEDIAIWKQLEEIKNKYGGMPPETAKSAVPVDELKAGPKPLTDAQKAALNPKRFAQEQAAKKASEVPTEELKVEGVESLDPASGTKLSATDALINKLESMKFAPENTGRLYSLPHPDAIGAIGKSVWNTGIDVAIAAIKAGRAAGDAISDAIDYIKKNASGFNEDQLRNNLDYILKQEAPRPTPAAASAETPARAANAGLDDVYKRFEPDPKEATPLTEMVSRGVEAIRTGFSSKFRPIDKLAEDIAKTYGTPSQKGIAGIFEQIKGSSGRAEADVYRFDQAVSKKLKGLEKDFNAYMFLKRSLDRLRQDQADIQRAIAGEEVKTLNRRAVSDYTIPELESKLRTLEEKVGPDNWTKLEKGAEEFQGYLDRALRLQVDSGRMSAEVYNAIKNGNQFYAPFKVMKYFEDTARPEGTGRNIDTTAEYTKAMEGIEDPNFKLGDMLGAARHNIAMSRILADKNNAMRRLADLASIDVESRFTKRLGKDEDVPRGMEAVNVFENGRQVRYAVDPHIADALKVHGRAGRGIISDMLSYGSIAFRAGATALNIPFQISNLMADIPRAALVSKYGINGVTDMVTFPIDFVRAMYGSFMGNVMGRKNKMFLDFLDSGAAGTTVQEYLTPNGLRFVEPNNISRSKKLAQTVINTLPDFSTAIEQTSKVMGVQRAMRFHGKESGAQLAREIPEAITEIRRFSGSPDFGRQGKWVEQGRLNLLYMFLNARIQGTTADLGRLVGRDGGGTAAKTWTKLAIAVGLPTAYLYMMNNSDEYAEDYAKRPKQEKDNYWLIPKDSFITTESGEKIRDYWRIPKRESSKWIANMVESALNFAEKRDPKSVAQFAQNMIEDISPVNIQGDTFQERAESIGASLNPLIKAPLEAATGRDMYRHKDIIPESQKKASPERQYTDRTAEVFKKLAEAVPDVAPEMFRSPLMLENMTKNLTAGLITQFLPRKPVEGRSDLENNPLLQRFQAVPFTDSSEFEDKMSGLERESANEQLDRYRAANQIFQDNRGKSIIEAARAVVQNHGADEKLMQRVVDLWIAEQRGIDSQERRVLALPVEQRARYVLGELNGVTPEKKRELIIDMANKRILTEEVAQRMIEQGLRP